MPGEKQKIKIKMNLLNIYTIKNTSLSQKLFAFYIIPIKKKISFQTILKFCFILDFKILVSNSTED